MPIPKLKVCSVYKQRRVSVAALINCRQKPEAVKMDGENLENNPSKGFESHSTYLKAFYAE